MAALALVYSSSLHQLRCFFWDSYSVISAMDLRQCACACLLSPWGTAWLGRCLLEAWLSSESIDHPGFAYPLQSPGWLERGAFYSWRRCEIRAEIHWVGKCTRFRGPYHANTRSRTLFVLGQHLDCLSNSREIWAQSRHKNKKQLESWFSRL